MDASRTRNYIRDFEQHRKPLSLSRPELEKHILKNVSSADPQHLDSFFEWLRGIPTMGELDCTDSQMVIQLIRHAQRAKHDYAELLNAAFRIDTGQLEKWLLIILKIGRYGVASRAFAELAIENPTLFDRMTVHSLAPPPPKTFVLTLTFFSGDSVIQNKGIILVDFQTSGKVKETLTPTLDASARLTSLYTPNSNC